MKNNEKIYPKRKKWENNETQKHSAKSTIHSTLEDFQRTGVAGIVTGIGPQTSTGAKTWPESHREDIFKPEGMEGKEETQCINLGLKSNGMHPAAWVHNTRSLLSYSLLGNVLYCSCT